MQKIRTEWGVFNYPDGDHIGSTMKGGHYESVLIYRIMDKADFRRVAVDVGANIGTHTIPYAKVFRETHAFEPYPAALECLHANIKQNLIENVFVHEVALGDFDGKVLMGADTESTNIGAVKIRPKGSTEVLLRTLDSYQLKDVGLIKIDVEGYEGRVVRGGMITIAESRPIILFEQGVKDTFFDIASFLLCDLRYSKIERISKNLIAYP